MGADPEFVIVDAAGNPLPAHMFGIPDKNNPVKAFSPDGSDVGFYHRDGYNVEINPYPARCREALSQRIHFLLKAVQATLPPGLTLAPISSYNIDLGSLAGAPPDVQEFGCEPSFDAYNGGEPKTCILNGMTHSRRYCGGHIHLSQGDMDRGGFLGDKSEHPQFIKEMDRYVGVVIAYLLRSESQFDRRRHYGQAGEYRTQKYSNGTVGVEYRTPPAEMWAHPFAAHLAFGIARWVVEQHTFLKNGWDRWSEPITRNAINTGEGLENLLPTIPDIAISPAIIKRWASAPRLREFVYLSDPKAPFQSEAALWA